MTGNNHFIKVKKSDSDKHLIPNFLALIIFDEDPFKSFVIKCVVSFDTEDFNSPPLSKMIFSISDRLIESDPEIAIFIPDNLPITFALILTPLSKISKINF